MRTLRRVLLLPLLLALLGGAPARAATDPVGTWPLHPAPEVLADFDPPSTTWGAGHRGVDLAGRVGQQVLAALPGRVSFVGSIAGRPVLTVDHGPTRTTYEPVASSLSRGDRVGAGEAIGLLVLPGSHCFPAACLHWGWLRGETYLDPLRLVGGGAVRLLPLTGSPSAALPTARSRAAFPSGSPYAGWRPSAGVRLWP